MSYRLPIVRSLFLGLLAVCIAPEILHAQKLQETLEDVHVGDRWAYNHWESAKAASAKSKKPILALFRCVP